MRMRTFIALVASLSPAMAAAAPNPNAAAMLERLQEADANRDGNVTKQEVLNFRAANFTRLDRDRNGVLTRGDIPALAASMNPDIDFDRLIKMFDANGNNQVSRDEFVGGPTAYFDSADTNRDGILTKAERKAAIAAAKR